MLSIPSHVVDYIRVIFGGCNKYVSARLSKIPTTHEENLDHSLIEYLGDHSFSRVLDENWGVRIDAQYMGGGKHYYGWEIADIGILIFFRVRGNIQKVKVALLQSKRLYPVEVTESLHSRNPRPSSFDNLFEAREFSFTESSKYNALSLHTEQFERIQQYQIENNIPVYYLFYNPLTLPEVVKFPLDRDIHLSPECIVGCRIVTASSLKNSFNNKGEGYKPSYLDLKNSLNAPFNTPEDVTGWRLESFVADLLLGCKEGYKSQTIEDEEIQTVLFRRTAPIWAAISITIDSPN